LKPGPGWKKNAVRQPLPAGQGDGVGPGVLRLGIAENDDLGKTVGLVRRVDREAHMSVHPVLDRGQSRLIERRGDRVETADAPCHTHKPLHRRGKQG